MTRARRSMVIVTCFQPRDIDGEPHGPRHRGAAPRSSARSQARTTAEHVPDDSDPMLVDLARRLEAKGIPVALGHRGKLGLVAAHDGVCVTIETDSTLVAHEPARVAARASRDAAPARLALPARARFQLFTDPDAVATRVAEVLGIGARRTTQPTVQPISTVRPRRPLARRTPRLGSPRRRRRACQRSR